MWERLGLDDAREHGHTQAPRSSGHVITYWTALLCQRYINSEVPILTSVTTITAPFAVGIGFSSLLLRQALIMQPWMA